MRVGFFNGEGFANPMSLTFSIEKSAQISTKASFSALFTT